MVRLLLTGAAVIAIDLAVPVPAQAGLLYSQPTDYADAFASQNDTSNGGMGNYATTYDDFTLTTAASVASVSWVGSYFGQSGTNTVTGFTLSFWANNAGVPGAMMASTDVSGNANETLLIVDPNGFTTNSYSANLTAPFSAAAGTTYWLSIVGDLAIPPQWGWETGTGGNSEGYNVFEGKGSFTGTDFAFSLFSANVVPEPSTFVIAGQGGVVLLAYRWLRRRRKGVRKLLG
jgi:hypothetical protein